MPGLIVVQTDRAPLIVRRRGVFTIDRACARDPKHLTAAIKRAQERFIEGMAKQGYEYIDSCTVDGVHYEGFTMSEPLAHVEVSEDTDDYDLRVPPPTDMAELERWETAERARLPKRFDVEPGDGLVDYCIVACFKHTTRAPYRSNLWTPR